MMIHRIPMNQRASARVAGPPLFFMYAELDTSALPVWNPEPYILYSLMGAHHIFTRVLRGTENPDRHLTFDTVLVDVQPCNPLASPKGK